MHSESLRRSNRRISRGFGVANATPKTASEASTRLKSADFGAFREAELLHFLHFPKALESEESEESEKSEESEEPESAVLKLFQLQMVVFVAIWRP